MLCFKAISRAILYNVLSRMRSRCNLILEFFNATIVNSLPHLPASIADDNYLIEALSSRGFIVKDHFLTIKFDLIAVSMVLRRLDFQKSFSPRSLVLTDAAEHR
ncbi:hypothetical protein L596_027680 [Steinernema carpocapsae]|uniref:Uncharacterized protein n=1 Tax=Steinernema carpocapsae TaxID=34508 RepID=A0A4U5LW71_STECR|nr:hypothetical protein L596_027680 [Steinernema carpocapsae]